MLSQQTEFHVPREDVKKIEEALKNTVTKKVEPKVDTKSEGVRQSLHYGRLYLPHSPSSFEVIHLVGNRRTLGDLGGFLLYFTCLSLRLFVR